MAIRGNRGRSKSAVCKIIPLTIHAVMRIILIHSLRPPLTKCYDRNYTTPTGLPAHRWWAHPMPTVHCKIKKNRQPVSSRCPQGQRIQQVCFSWRQVNRTKDKGRPGSDSNSQDHPRHGDPQRANRPQPSQCPAGCPRVSWLCPQHAHWHTDPRPQAEQDS